MRLGIDGFKTRAGTRYPDLSVIVDAATIL